MKRSPARQLRAFLEGFGYSEDDIADLLTKQPSHFRQMGKSFIHLAHAGYNHIERAKVEAEAKERANEQATS